ncbi:MAG TPA: hypothetical protein VNK95_04615, partial [Caldilineaceae bacterium]|nr:hypothetical protein [Caldilineaceae bacterium]
AAVFGVLGVLALFGLAHEAQRLAPGRLSPALPWLAAGSLATMRWHLHFSRMGIEPILVPLLWAAANWLLLRGWRTGSGWAYAGCGLALALGMYAYQGAWTLPFVVAATALHLLWAARLQDRSQIGGRLARLGVAAGVALIGVAPLAWTFAQQPDLLLLRPAQLAIVGQTDSPADSSLGAALWATAKMFGPLGAPGDLDPRRNLPGAPALNLWQAIPFYLGLALALWRMARPIFALPLVGLAGLLLPGVFSEYAPHFHRVLGAAGPAALLCGLGLDTIWQGGRRAGLRLAGPPLAAGLLVIGAASAAQTYFVRWAALPDLFYAFDAGLWELGRWTAALPANQPLYVTPRGPDHPTLAFAWRSRPAPVGFDGRYLFPHTTGTNGTPEHYAVVEHEDFRTPLLLPAVLPAASTVYTLTDFTGQPYAQVYTRPAGSTPDRPPQTPVAATLGDGIKLMGYDVLPQPPRAGEILYLQLHWIVVAPPAQDWTVFTHVLAPNGDEAGAVVAGHDSRPGQGSLPTVRWQPGWRILDEYQIPLPDDLPPGEYALAVGLYLADGARLPAEGPGVMLGTVTVEAQE